VVAGDVGEAEGLPGGSCRVVVWFGGEIEPSASPSGGLLLHAVQQCVGDAVAAVVGVGDDVLDVDVVGVVLAAEGDDRADDLVVVDRDRAGGGEQLGVEPVIGGRSWPDVGPAESDEVFEGGDVLDAKQRDDLAILSRSAGCGRGGCGPATPRSMWW